MNNSRQFRRGVSPKGMGVSFFPQQRDADRWLDKALAQGRAQNRWVEGKHANLAKGQVSRRRRY